MIRVLIADDHHIFRAGLKQILEDESDIVISEEACNGQEVIDKVIKKDFDVVVLDISMPGRTGIEILKQLVIIKPGLPILILSTYPEDQYAIRSMKAGASGYLTKDSTPENLGFAIRKVFSGGKYITASLAEKLAFEIERGSEKPIHQLLSDREYEILCMIASGKTVSDIARELFLSAKTISTYRKRVLEKMKLKNNAELTYYAIRNNIID